MMACELEHDRPKYQISMFQSKAARVHEKSRPGWGAICRNEDIGRRNGPLNLIINDNVRHVVGGNAGRHDDNGAQARPGIHVTVRLQVLELVGELEDHFNIAVPLNRLTHIRTVAQIASEVRRLVAEQDSKQAT